MAKQSQNELDRMIQRAKINNRDLVRRDINQIINSAHCNLVLKLGEYFYNDGTSKELLYLAGTVVCQYKGSRYNIPIEIWIQPDHPHTAPFVYVKPTTDMYISKTTRDVELNGIVIIPYLTNWRHPNSDLNSLLKSLSDAFSISPPVYSSGGGTANQSNHGSYPPNPPSIGTHQNLVTHQQLTHTQGRPHSHIPHDVYRDSIQTAVLSKIRHRLKETLQVGSAEIESLKKTEQDLIDGEKKIQSLIKEAQQQQTQAQKYLEALTAKTNEVLDATQQMSTSSSGKENSIKDDALIAPAPVYKQLLQAYAEEHAIQDLLYYLADGLRRESIGLETYLKHVTELSRKQFMLRATMYRCRQVAGLPIR